MTEEDNQFAEKVIDLISKQYDINLCTPVAVTKEAVDVAAYLMKKHTRMKNFAIAKVLNRSTNSEFATKAMHTIDSKKSRDNSFLVKILDLEIALLRSI